MAVLMPVVRFGSARAHRLASISLAADAGSRLELDLLDPWPASRGETFVTASAGLLGARYLPLVVSSAVGAAVLWWRRRSG
jgi:hypothetical protein